MEGIEMTFGRLRNDFTAGYELTDFVGYEMTRLRNDCKPS